MRQSDMPYALVQKSARPTLPSKMLDLLETHIRLGPGVHFPTDLQLTNLLRIRLQSRMS